MQLTIGDYTFTTAEETGLGDIVIRVTDYLGTNCGMFYGDVNDTEEEFRENCEAWIQEEESPEGT